MIRLRRLVVHRFRSVKPECTLEFSDRFNVVLGKNGTGKTTLLKLITILLTSDFESLDDEAVDVEYDLAFANWTLRIHVTNAPLATLIGVNPQWNGSAQFFDSTGKPISEKEDIGLRIIPSGQRFSTTQTPSRGLVSATILTSESINDPKRDDSYKAATNLEQTVRRFDEALHAFQELQRKELNSTAHYHERMQPAIGMTIGETPSYQSAYFAQSIWDSLKTWAAQADAQSAELGETDFVRDTNALLDGPTVRWRMNVVERRVVAGHHTIAFSGFSFTVKLPNGTELNSAETLSFGQKRLIAFMYYLACNPHVVIADELVNGMHHSWLEALMPEIERRQSFLAIQNPLLLDYLWFDSAEELRRSFVLCRQSEDAQTWTWGHMDVEQAAAIYEAYRQGFQHVSTILKSYGVW